MQKKVLVLFSGGLDSILCVELLRKQNFEIIALTFTTPFFDAEKTKESTQKLGIKHIVKEITDEHLKIVKNPPRGYGKNMNPCIDCHGLMFKIAGEISRDEGFDIIATGEVLGQRPFSQNKQALQLIAKMAGMESKILRPLSAKNLPETEYEKEGIVDREKLLDFEGKGRKPQLALAKKWGINYFPTPAGGCLLTDPGFSKRLKDLFEHHPEAEKDEINLLKVGRQFWAGENKVVIGRDKEDNQKMKDFFDSEQMIFLKLKDFPGPLGVIYVSKENDLEASLKLASEKIKYYSLKTRDLDEVSVVYSGKKKGEVCC
jgi:tRNA U34 2-thiouridine synthase MnmA/TrmU